MMTNALMRCESLFGAFSRIGISGASCFRSTGGLILTGYFALPGVGEICKDDGIAGRGLFESGRNVQRVAAFLARTHVVGTSFSPEYHRLGRLRYRAGALLQTQVRPPSSPSAESQVSQTEVRRGCMNGTRW